MDVRRSSISHCQGQADQAARAVVPPSGPSWARKETTPEDSSLYLHLNPPFLEACQLYLDVTTSGLEVQKLLEFCFVFPVLGGDQTQVLWIPGKPTMAQPHPQLLTGVFWQSRLRLLLQVLIGGF